MDAIPKAIEQVGRSDIIVTASSREQLRDILSPGVVSVVYPDDTRGEHKSLPELLDQIPGVFVRRVGGTGQYTTTSIRGSAPSQVNIYIDGVPYNTSSEVAADISTIPVGNVERVEVYRGTVPARFSGAPLGGAINIVTKKATGLSGTVSAGARSFGGWQTAANFNTPLLGGSLLLGFDTDHSKGDFTYRNYAQQQFLDRDFGNAAYTGDGKPDTYYSSWVWFEDGAGGGERVVNNRDYYLPVARRRQNNSFQKDNILVRWTTDHFSAKYSFTYLDRLQPSNAGFVRSDIPAYTYPLSVPDNGVANPRYGQKQRQHDIALGWHDTIGKVDLSAALNAMDQDKQFANTDQFGIGGIGRFSSDFHTRRYGAQLDAAYTLGETWPITQRIEFHAQGSRETMRADANDSGDGSAEQAGYYHRFRRHLVNFQAQDTIMLHPLGDLQITPIARVERLFGPTLGAKENPFGPSSGNYGWKPTFSVSAKKNLGNLLLFADTGSYNRYPNFYEIYGDGVFVQAGSSALRDLTPLLREHGRNTDAGFGWNGNVFDGLRASFRTTFFRRKTYDTITLYSTPVGSKYINSGTTLTRGVEFEGNLVAGKFADLQMAASYQNGHYVEGSYYLFGGMSAKALVPEGKKLSTLQNPRITLDARLNLHFLDGALTNFIEVKHVGRRYNYQLPSDLGSTLSYETPLTTIDLGGHFSFSNGVKLSFGVNDLFDQGPKQRQKPDGQIGDGSSDYRCNFGQAEISGDYSCYDDPNNYYLKALHGSLNSFYPQQGRTFYFTIAKNFGAKKASGSGMRRSSVAAQANGSWTGFHVGGAVGRGWAPRHGGEVLVFDTNANGAFIDKITGANIFDSQGGLITDDAFDPRHAGRGFDGRGIALGAAASGGIRADRSRRASYGVRGGYDRQIGDWVIGAVGEWSRYDLTDSVSAYGVLKDEQGDFRDSLPPASYTFTRHLNSIASLRARGGLAWLGVLGYATVGLARGSVAHAFATTDTVNKFSDHSGGKALWGYQWGAGIEARVAGPFTLGLEFLHTRLRDRDYTVHAGVNPDRPIHTGFEASPGRPGTDIKRSSSYYEIDSLRLTVGYRF
ncbi:TonB-dependent receptor domain-containing protein [Sphingomonas sp. ERG5]|uniref:TonB-dependent receptor domain-containing protein n=1 Tax=Sphingomonas sp. ERG5 TaxID=1381597 RepID=UPI000ABC7883|nr:TonB-dependent receptor [Sphingomonas sp. ERG5]